MTPRISSHHYDAIITPLKGKKEIKVLFVCLGNICRSPAAEGLMCQMLKSKGDHRWSVDSAGIGSWHVGDLPDTRMREAARRRGVTLNHHCRQVHDSDFAQFDLILGMDDTNVDNLKYLAPSVEDAEKVLPMAAFFSDDVTSDSVPDPYYGGAKGFDLVLDLLDDALTNLYNALQIGD